jgi:hypothetical protein
LPPERVGPAATDSPESLERPHDRLHTRRDRRRVVWLRFCLSSRHWLKERIGAHSTTALAGSLIVLALWETVCPSEPPASSIQRFVEGVDALPQAMTEDEVNRELNDPWAVNLLRKRLFPSDLDHTLAALTATGLFPDQDSFFVSESGTIPVRADTAGLQRAFRVVVTRGGPTDNLPPVLISAPAGDRSGFIELMSWDPGKRAFNFYRHPPSGQWTWKGDTRLAFQPATHGKGCFACHVTGVPLMKELKLPWINWHSQTASIPPEAIPDADMRTGALFKDRSQAEDLETVIHGWVDRATEARIVDLMKGDVLADGPRLLRPLFATTTVNLATSATQSGANTPDLALPPGLFLNFDALAEVNITAPGFSRRVKRPLYENTLTKFAFKLEQDSFSMKGDVHFAFLVPEAALEELVTLRKLLAQKVVTRHFAASVLLVDFPNPVFSAAREGLLRYVPATGHIADGRSDLSERTAQAILQATDGSPPRARSGSSSGGGT